MYPRKLPPSFLLQTNCMVLSSRSSHWFQDIQMGPPDPILGINEAYKKCTSPQKVNAGVGAYRDENGKPFVLKCVLEAKRRIMERPEEHGYAPVGGSQEFCDMAAKMVFGDNSKSIAGKLNASVQSIACTGALRLATTFFHKFLPCNKMVWMSSPPWNNHVAIAEHESLSARKYHYYDPTTGGFDSQNFLNDLLKIPSRSIVLLQVCAHNPTGVDPTKEVWKEMSSIFKMRKLFPFFDMAYQGFATGDMADDAFPVRLFEQEGHEMVVCQSFAKNMGLYGERVGAFHVITTNKSEAQKVLSQIRILIRPKYSNPPTYGAKIVTEVTRDPELKEAWLKEIKEMVIRIVAMRTLLKENLVRLGSKRNWDFITNQTGMFCYTGLNTEQCDMMRKKYHIFMAADGRMSIPGLNNGNIEYVANAIHEITA